MRGLRKTGWRCSRPSAPFYKYDFESALLIAAQRPQATACATMQAWNRHGLWVRKGSRAIFTLHPSDPYAVRRVFDIARHQRQSRTPAKAMVVALGTCRWRSPPCGRRGALRKKPVTACRSMLRSWTRQWTASPTIAMIFWMRAQPVCFSGMDENSRALRFHTLCINSAFCIVLHRLQMPIPEEISAASFEDAPLLDSWDVQLAVGAAAHATASSVLRQIERAVKEAARDNIDHGREMWNNGSREEPLYAPEGTGPARAQTGGRGGTRR